LPRANSARPRRQERSILRCRNTFLLQLAFAAARMCSLLCGVYPGVCVGVVCWWCARLDGQNVEEISIRKELGTNDDQPKWSSGGIVTDKWQNVSKKWSSPERNCEGTSKREFRNAHLCIHGHKSDAPRRYYLGIRRRSPKSQRFVVPY
jgi:hypothetical protein